MHFALHNPTLCCALKDEQCPWSLTLNARCTPGAVITTTTCPTFPNAPPQGAVQPPLPGTEPASVLSMDLSSGARMTCLGLNLPLLGEQQNLRPLGRDHGQTLPFGDRPPDQRKGIQRQKLQPLLRHRLGFEFSSDYLLAEWLQASFLTSLSLSFLICTMGARIPF